MGMAIRMAFEVSPILAGRDWLVLFRESEKKAFVTTDAPVMLTTTGPRESNFWGVWTTANTEKMRHINLAMADRCQRFVVGRDVALLESLAKFLGLANRKWQPKMQPQ